MTSFTPCKNSDLSYVSINVVHCNVRPLLQEKYEFAQVDKEGYFCKETDATVSTGKVIWKYS